MLVLILLVTAITHISTGKCMVHRMIFEFLSLNETVGEDKRSCAEWYAAGVQFDGLYYIYPKGSDRPIEVFCDMKTAGGGWTVLVRRMNGQEPFNRSWADYRNGFGKPACEYWMGNEFIHLMTDFESSELRVDLWDCENKTFSQVYNTFFLSSEQDGYRLVAGNSNGTAGDGFIQANNAQLSQLGMKFSTFDRDNDQSSGTNCAKELSSGFWFNDCGATNLAHPYSSRCKFNGYKELAWGTGPDGKGIFPQRAEMKFRPRIPPSPCGNGKL